MPKAQERGSAAPDHDDLENPTPPRYTIDLSLPARQRYQRLALIFKERLLTLPALFTLVVEDARMPPKLAQRMARLCLRKLHSQEETEELQGISQVTGIEMYLLVAFNVLLDLFMGCTSGGVQIREPKGEAKMLHFRTLDWGMDVLRRVIVVLDFVQDPEGPVIASSVSYVGYVGMLTGVKKGLSMSLNFRPCHDRKSALNDFRFYFNHLMVLLGVRPSISSLLRQMLLPTPTKSTGAAPDWTLSTLEEKLPAMVTTAAYLIFCDGDKTLVLEKDRASARMIASAEFVAATNHDVAEEDPDQRSKATTGTHTQTALHITGMDSLVEESIDRKGQLCGLWKATMQKRAQTRSGKQTPRQQHVRQADVIRWMNTYPITNEETHFATIMDPKLGSIVWTHRYTEPCGVDGDQSHHLLS